MVAQRNPRERFPEALHMAAHGYRLDMDRRLKPLGLSRAAWMALATAARAETAPTQIEMADALGIEPASLVSLIDRLEKAGLVKRVQDASDRRAKRVEPTAGGNRLFGKIRHEAIASRDALLEGASAADIAAAVRLLEHVRQKAEALR